MDLQPNVSKLVTKEVYALVTISIAVVLCLAIIQILVVNLDAEVENTEFVRYVWPWVLAALIILWVLDLWLRKLWFNNLQYFIEDERLLIHKGILTKKKVSIPYAAITDFTLNRSLYDRWLGMGSIFVQTAGQSTQPGLQEGKLEGLVDFDEINASLRAKVKAYRGDVLEKTPRSAQPGSSDAEILQSILEEVMKIGQKLS